ncbi:hypothetical protein NKR23_g3423 [Pleurostoma richardsiae]|uniref:Uncharacterized protein n=1 Tax=Pleurostoma richardsiae TaxID=41990 RepID=A0AA38RL13_9PEZI|nr:hypothetical protein NKR23_g3423 [Pleurostoma richardsiae]
MAYEPEVYRFSQTAYVPNNRLPVLRRNLRGGGSPTPFSPKYTRVLRCLPRILYTPTSEHDYRYVGVYPKGAPGSPKWKNECCRDKDTCSSLRSEVGKVPVPERGSVGGRQGSLLDLWALAA